MNTRIARRVLCLALFTAGAAALHAQAAEESAGFPVFKSVRAHLLPPVIDGFITDGLPEGVKPDTGWRAAGRITLANGVSVPDVAFQGLKEAQGDFLDLSFEVRHDPSLDEGDAVIIGLRPSEDGAAAEWRAGDVVVIVYPFSGTAATAAVGAAPARVEIWRDAGEGGWQDVSALVKGCLWSVRAFATAADAFGWDLEARLPAQVSSGGDAWIDIPDRFSFSFNVVRVQSGAMPTVSQFFWPRRGRPLVGSLETAALPPLAWGRADKSDADVHKGLWIGPRDIAAGPGDPQNPQDDFLVLYDKTAATPNSFFATVRNDSSRALGTIYDYPSIENVSVAFRTADWGLPGPNPGPDWKDVDEQFTPAKGFTNPVKPKTVPMADNPTKPGTATFEFKGDFGPRLPEGVQIPERRCLYAEILGPAGTSYREQGVYRNMMYMTAPVFDQAAIVSVRGYGRPPAGKSGFVYLLRSEKKMSMLKKTFNSFAGQEIISTDESNNENRSDINSYLEWTLHGFLVTGDTLSIRGRNFPVALPTGSFGYRVHRPTEVRSWNETVTGAEPLDSSTYRLEIPADQTAQVMTSVKADESAGLFLAVRGGAAVPLFLYAGSYCIGPSSRVEFGIKATQVFSAVLSAGYSFLIDPAGGNGFNLFFAMLDVRAVMELGPLIYIYMQGGAYGYTPDFSFFDLGLDIGLTVGMTLSKNLSLELGLNYDIGLISQDNRSGVLMSMIGLVLDL